MNVDVYCTNSVCGRSIYVVLNPKTQQVTHIVVQEKGLVDAEYLVPLEDVVESSPNHIKLRVTKAEMIGMPQFMQNDYQSTESMFATGMAFDPIIEMYDGYALWPYDTMGSIMTAAHEEIPLGEVVLMRGSHIIATDGNVGRLAEFLTNPMDGKITHIVLREGHLWNQKDVTIPVAQIDRIEEDKVYLKLTKQAVGMLPAMRV
jgi:sporulation protein YlmC with PRC-barrel domain